MPFINYYLYGEIMKMLLIFIVILFLQPVLSLADWDEYACTSKARNLYRLSQDAESAKSEFESACSDWGYQKDDEYACGSYGYVRTNYESAISDVEYAASSANRYCGGTGNSMIKKLEQYIKYLQEENKKLNEKIKALEKQ